MRLNFQYPLSFLKSTASEVGSEAEHSVHDLSTITPLWISFYGFLNANRLSYSLLASKMPRASFCTPALPIIFLSSRKTVARWRRAKHTSRRATFFKTFKAAVWWLVLVKILKWDFLLPTLHEFPKFLLSLRFCLKPPWPAGSWASAGCEGVAQLLRKHVRAHRRATGP